MKALATDMDRTLLPNGKQEYDGSMKDFRKIVKGLYLIYVTGRNINEVKEGVRYYKTPYPDYVVGEVGTKVYYVKNKSFREDKEWIRLISERTKGWNVSKFKEKISRLDNIRLQERKKQNRFKLSYYVDDPHHSKKVVDEVRRIVRGICKDTQIVYSVDETKGIGLLDILPKKATKVAGLEYIRKKLGLRKEEIIYSGDSGNDILPLTFGYNSILVRNALKEVRDEAKKRLRKKVRPNKLYVAKGKEGNGYYVSGIIEGLKKYKVIHRKANINNLNLYM